MSQIWNRAGAKGAAPVLANAQTCAVLGLDGFVVQVEVDISPGLPAFNIVGLPDTAVQEAKERVRAALRNSGCEFPLRRITVNLAPADLKKEGPSYDLPIAVCMLLSSGQIDTVPAGAVFLGELSLEAALRHTKGILAMVSVARDRGLCSQGRCRRGLSCGGHSGLSCLQLEGTDRASKV